MRSLVDFAQGESELRTILPAYGSGRAAMLRSVAEPASASGVATQQRWYRSWLDALAGIDSLR